MDELKDLLGEDLYNQVTAKLGDKKAAIVSTGQWIPKSKFDELNVLKKQQDDALKERDGQLSTLQKAAGDNEALKKQITDLQTSNQQQADKFAADMKELQMNNALRLGFTGKVHDVDVALGLIDKTKVTLSEDGSIASGFEEQVTALKDQKGYLFTQEQKAPNLFVGFTPAAGQSSGGGGGTTNFGQFLVDQAKANQSTQQQQVNYFE